MMTLLFPDETPTGRALVRDARTASGYLLVKTDDGHDPLLKMTGVCPIVRLDNHMPGLDGCAAVRTVRQGRSGCRLLISGEGWFEP